MPSTRSWIYLAVTLWGLALLVVSVRVLVQPRSHSVYPIFAQAGCDWLDGIPLYGKKNRGLDQFRYSPLIAATFAPFSALPDRAGNLLWRWLNAAVLLGGLAWWLRAARTARTDSAWVFILVLPMALGNMNNGQSNTLVLGLLLAAVAGTAEGRWTLASIAIAAACVFKVYPIAVGLLLAVVYPKRFTPRFAVALAAGVALPFLFQRWAYVAEQYATWLRTIGGDDRQRWPVEATYRDFRLLCRVWWEPLTARTYSLVQLGLAAAIAGICFFKSGHLRKDRTAVDQRETLLLLFALASCWMTVFGAATESATYILLGPALTAVLVQVWRERRPRWEQGAVTFSYGLFILTQMSSWFPFGTRFHSYGPQPAAGLVFFGYLLVRASGWHALRVPQGVASTGPRPSGCSGHATHAA
jgi:hypothetical protein